MELARRQRGCQLLHKLHEHQVSMFLFLQPPAEMPLTKAFLGGDSCEITREFVETSAELQPGSSLTCMRAAL